MSSVLCGKVCQYGQGCKNGVPTCILARGHGGKCICGSEGCGERIGDFCNQNVTDVELFKDLCKCNIRFISVSICQRVAGMDWGTNFASLTKLNLNGLRYFSSYLFSNATFPSLLALSITNCPLVDCKGWKDIPTLKHLEIGCNRRMNLRDWTKKTFRLRNLKIINRPDNTLMDMTNEDIFGRSAIEIGRFDDLEILKLKHIKSLKGETWPSCKNLKVLKCFKVPLNDKNFTESREYPEFKVFKVGESELQKPYFSDSFFKNLEVFSCSRNFLSFLKLKMMIFGFNYYNNVKYPLTGEEMERMVNLPHANLKSFCPRDCRILVVGGHSFEKKKNDDDDDDDSIGHKRKREYFDDDEENSRKRKMRKIE